MWIMHAFAFLAFLGQLWNSTKAWTAFMIKYLTASMICDKFFLPEKIVCANVILWTVEKVTCGIYHSNNYHFGAPLPPNSLCLLILSRTTEVCVDNSSAILEMDRVCRNIVYIQVGDYHIKKWLQCE